MDIVLRDYQERAISELGIEGEQVLSICPSGGKTYTAIEYALRNPQFKRVLILTHATNMLKSQWSKDFEFLSIPYSTQLNDKNRFTLTIPQAISKADVPQFDLVIVDEAHEYYFTEDDEFDNGMIKKILNKASPKCILFLTGTPSKFIRNGFKPVIISGCEIFNDINGKKYLCDTYFGMVRSSYLLDFQNFGSDGETLKFDMTERDTEQSFNSLVKEMLKRLSANKIIKKSPNLSSGISRMNMSAFQEAFGALGKTLIAARNIDQANKLKDILVKHKISVLTSESKGDKDSECIEEFQQPDNKTQVLIVVRRGVLGFNMPTLINVVDFTMSRNIDRIYQLYARVLRVHPEGKDKFYFKMCSSLNPNVDSIYFQAAVCLNNTDFISKYNGKNLKSLPILIKTKHKDKKEITPGPPKPPNPTSPKIDEDMLMEVISLGLMSEMVINPNSKHWKEFEYTTFSSAISKLNGKEFRSIINITEDNLLFMIKNGVVDERIYE